MKPSAESVPGRAPSGYALDAHHRVTFACLLAVATLAGMHGRYALPTQLIMAWDVFALTVVGLAWIIIWRKDPYEGRGATSACRMPARLLSLSS